MAKEIWTWKDYGDSGGLVAPDGKEYFSYDAYTGEYKITPESEYRNEFDRDEAEEYIRQKFPDAEIEFTTKYINLDADEEYQRGLYLDEYEERVIDNMPDFNAPISEEERQTINSMFIPDADKAMEQATEATINQMYGDDFITRMDHDDYEAEQARLAELDVEPEWTDADIAQGEYVDALTDAWKEYRNDNPTVNNENPTQEFQEEFDKKYFAEINKEKSFDLKNTFSYGGMTYIPVRAFQNQDEINNIFANLTWKDAIVQKGKNSDFGYSNKDFLSHSPDDKADIFYCVEKGKLYTPHSNGIICLNADGLKQTYDTELYNFKNTITPALPKFDREKDIQTMQQIASVLEDGEVYTKQNETLGDVRIRLGNNNSGLSHIAKRRLEERLLNEKVAMPLEDAKLETSAILFLAVKNIEEKNAVRENNGNYGIYNNGIKTTITKDKNGHYVLTGFDYKDTKQESEVAIKSVIAQYGYAQDFLGIYNQVGAIANSLQNNIPQEQSSVNEKSQTSQKTGWNEIDEKEWADDMREAEEADKMRAELEVKRILDTSSLMHQVDFIDWFNKNKSDRTLPLDDYKVAEKLMDTFIDANSPIGDEKVHIVEFTNGKFGYQKELPYISDEKYLYACSADKFLQWAYEELRDKTKVYERETDKNYRSLSEENKANSNIRIMLQDKDLLAYMSKRITDEEYLSKVRMGNLSFEKNQEGKFFEAMQFYDDPIESMEAFVNGTDDERAAMTKEFRERNFAKDKNLFAELKDTLSEGTVFVGKNKTLGDIQIRRGNKHTGLVHIIERRYAERVLNKKVLMEPEQAKKEITAISFLVADSLEKQEAVKQVSGKWKIDNGGIEAIIAKDAKGRFVLTGYDDNRQKKEATESINAVIAKYGNSPDFLDVYGQVGAVIASLQHNIQQEQNSVNKNPQTAQETLQQKYDDLHAQVYEHCTLTIDGKKTELKQGLLNEYCDARQELDQWQSMTPKDLRKLANDIERQNNKNIER